MLHRLVDLSDELLALLYGALGGTRGLIQVPGACPSVHGLLRTPIGYPVQASQAGQAGEWSPRRAGARLSRATTGNRATDDEERSMTHDSERILGAVMA